MPRGKEAMAREVYDTMVRECIAQNEHEDSAEVLWALVQIREHALQMDISRCIADDLKKQGDIGLFNNINASIALDCFRVLKRASDITDSSTDSSGYYPALCVLSALSFIRPFRKKNVSLCYSIGCVRPLVGMVAGTRREDQHLTQLQRDVHECLRQVKDIEILARGHAASILDLVERNDFLEHCGLITCGALFKYDSEGILTPCKKQQLSIMQRMPTGVRYVDKGMVALCKGQRFSNLRQMSASEVRYALELKGNYSEEVVRTMDLPEASQELVLVAQRPKIKSLAYAFCLAVNEFEEISQAPSSALSEVSAASVSQVGAALLA
jgi:hypothetical protein